MSAAPAIAGSGHERRYEALRRAAQQPGRALGERDGLALLLSRGVVAWMQAWSALTPVAPTPRPGPALAPATSARIVHVLAAMTLGHLREVQP